MLTPTLPPKPTGVPFAEPSTVVLGNSSPLPPQDWNNCSTLAEATSLLKRYQRAVLKIPGAAITQALQIVEMSAALGYVLTTPFQVTNPDSVGVLVITGLITVTPPPPAPGEPAPASFSGQLSDLAGNVYERMWVPDQEQFDRNYTQSGGANNVDTPAPGVLKLMFGAASGSVMAYWDLA
jgi:hypothetical protein